MNLKITSSTPQENNNEILQLIKIKQNTHALFLMPYVLLFQERMKH